MARLFTMGKLTCFSIFAKKNKVKYERPLSEDTKHRIEPCQNGSSKSINIDGALHSDLQNLSTYAKETVEHKDLMTIKPLNGSNDVLGKGDCSAESVVDNHQSKSMFGRQEGQFNGTGSDCHFSFGPQKAIMCNETPSEIAYEGEDEEENHSSSRELSDHESQKNRDNVVNSEFPTDVNTNTSRTVALCDYSSEITFEIDRKCGGDQYNEKMQSGHLSDPGVYKMGDLDSGFTSPVLYRSSSGSKLEMSKLYKFECGGRSPDNHSTQLPPSNSQSFEDLQHLTGVQGGIQGSPHSELTYCSADKVMLKRGSSSKVLPSRRRKDWWKIFLWSHRNSHKEIQSEQSPQLQKSEEAYQIMHRKGGYSSDTGEPSRNMHQTNQEDIGKLTSLEDINTINGLSKKQNIPNLQSRHKDWDHLSRDPSSQSYNQWMAFSSEQSNITRVEEWITSIDTGSLSLENGDSLHENDFSNPGGTVAGNSAAEISKVLLETSFPDGNLPEEMQLANNAIRSLNAFSTVAHISGIGLRVVPALAPFTSLRTINLSGNSIVRIASGSLPKSLHVLDLSRNKITAIEGLRELSRLRVLDLSYNKISRIGHGLANCTLIKELCLAGNKISDVEGLHRLLKLAVLDLSFNKVTTMKALGQLAANYNSLLALNLLGNPVHTNVGEEQLRKSISSLLPRLAYFNKQPIKTVYAREAAVDSVARAAMGNTGRHSRNKVSKRGSYASSSTHKSGASSIRGNRASEGTGRNRVRQNKHVHDKGKSRQEHLPSKRTPSASFSDLQKLGTAKSVNAH